MGTLPTKAKDEGRLVHVHGAFKGSLQGAVVGAGGEVVWRAGDEGQEPSAKYFKPLSMLHPLDSWRLWELVTAYLSVGDFAQAAHHKAQLEAKQRADSSLRKDQGLQHMPVLFEAGDEARLRDEAWLRRECVAAAVWPGSTLERDLPMVSRAPMDMEGCLE